MSDPQWVYSEQDRLLELARELNPDAGDWDDRLSVLSEREREFLRLAPCADCGNDILRIGEYFMLHHDVWALVIKGDESARLLCVGCIEERLGRRLTGEDFNWEVPLNRYRTISSRSSERLLDRMRAESSAERTPCKN